MTDTLPVTVVIPTYDRAHTLVRILPSILRQPIREILIVDDASPSEILPTLRANGMHDPRLRTHRLAHNQGSPAARNIGAEQASSPYLLFVDDDVLLLPGHVETLLQHLIDNKADLAAGRRIWQRPFETIEEATSQRGAVVCSTHLVNRRYISFEDEADFATDTVLPLIGATMLGRRDLFLRIRYEETLFRRTGWREETDFQVRAGLAGARLLACRHAIAVHLPKNQVGRGGGQRAGKRATYEYHILINNIRFLRRHRKSLASLGLNAGPSPVIGAIAAYVGYRIPSKIRSMLKRDPGGSPR